MPSSQTKKSSTTLDNALPKSMVRVFIVDDHELLRDGLTELLGNRAGMEVCGEAAGEEEAFAAVCSMRPDIVIADVSLQQGDGIQLVKRIKRHDHSIQVVVCSMYDEILYAERSLRAGASGYVHKQAPAHEMLDAIAQIMDGKIYTSPMMAKHAAVADQRSVQSSLESLADREMEVFTLIGQGRSNGEIAEQMGLSPRTIDTYRERIKTKLGLKTASELYRRAIAWELLNE